MKTSRSFYLVHCTQYKLKNDYVCCFFAKNVRRTQLQMKKTIEDTLFHASNKLKMMIESFENRGKEFVIDKHLGASFVVANSWACQMR